MLTLIFLNSVVIKRSIILIETELFVLTENYLEKLIYFN